MDILGLLHNLKRKQLNGMVFCCQMMNFKLIKNRLYSSTLEAQGDLTDTNKKQRSRVFIAWKCYSIPIKQWYRILFIPYGHSTGLTGTAGRPGPKGKCFNISYVFSCIIRTGQIMVCQSNSLNSSLYSRGTCSSITELQNSRDFRVNS